MNKRTIIARLDPDIVATIISFLGSNEVHRLIMSGVEDKSQLRHAALLCQPVSNEVIDRQCLYDTLYHPQWLGTMIGSRSFGLTISQEAPLTWHSPRQLLANSPDHQLYQHDFHSEIRRIIEMNAERREFESRFRGSLYFMLTRPQANLGEIFASLRGGLTRHRNYIFAMERMENVLTARAETQADLD